MKSKNKKSSGREHAPVSGSLRDEVLRLIQKERFKDAVKQGKLCFRADQSVENRRLLENAYFLRAQQLSRDGMPTSAVEVAEHLLEFGVTDSALLGQVASLLLRLGMTKQSRVFQDRMDDPEARERLDRQAVDEAVIHPERIEELSSELAAGARTVRATAALEEALERGDEARMGEVLRDVARSSPFADWKLFARGLAAHYRVDAEGISANWDRLDTGRAASGSPERLRTTGGSGEAGSIPLSLERLVFGEPILSQVEELRELVAEENWIQAFRMLGPARFSLVRIDRSLAVRLTGALYPSVIRAAVHSSFQEMSSLIATFTRVSEPLPIDPHWNRMRAMVWEGPHGDFETAEKSWRKYLEDLSILPVLTPSERPLAQALVLNYLAGEHAEYAKEFGEEDDEFDDDDDDFDDDYVDGHESYEAEARANAIACLQQSLAVYPDHLPTYQLVVKIYRDWDETDEAVAAAERLLEQFPNDYETLKFLTDQYSSTDQAAKAFDCIRRMRVLKPLDEEIVSLEKTGRINLAREHALAKRWEPGRAELAHAEQLQPAGNSDY